MHCVSVFYPPNKIINIYLKYYKQITYICIPQTLIGSSHKEVRTTRR